MIIDVFRGQHGTLEMKIHSRLPSISFGSLKIAEIYSSSPNVSTDETKNQMILSAKIQIQNPVIYNKDDCFADFNEFINKLGCDIIWKMAIKYQDYIVNTNNWCENFWQYDNMFELKNANPNLLNELYIDAFILLDDFEFVSYAKSLGYDEVIHIGNGESFDELEYRIFSESQILNLNIMKNFQKRNQV